MSKNHASHFYLFFNCFQPRSGGTGLAGKAVSDNSVPGFHEVVQWV
jgi:hypothetical protein